MKISNSQYCLLLLEQLLFTRETPYLKVYHSLLTIACFPFRLQKYDKAG